VSDLPPESPPEALPDDAPADRPAPELAATIGGGWWLAFGLLYLAIRLPLIGYRGLDLDEATSAHLAHRGLADVWAQVRANDIHPPLFYLLLQPLRKLTADERVLRLLPLAAGWGVCWAAARIALLIAGRRPALYTLLLCLAAPFAVQYSLYLRPSVLGACWAAFLTALAVAWWRARLQGDPEPHPRWWFIAAATLGLYTFYLVGAVLLAVALVGIAVLWRRWADLRRWVIACAIPGLLFLPWLPTFFAQRAGWAARVPTVNARGEPITTALPPNLQFELALQALVPRFPEFIDPRWALLVLIAAALASSIYARHRGPVQGRLMTGLIFLVLLVTAALWAAFETSPYPLQIRYLFLVLPLCWVLIGTGLAATGRFIGPALLAVVLWLAVIGTIEWTLQRSEDYRAAGRYLAARADPAAPVFVVAHFSAIGLAHYWPRGEHQMVPIKQFDANLPGPMGKVNAALGKQPPEVWVALARDQGGRWRGLHRGGRGLVRLLTGRYGQPEVMRYQGVTLFRWDVYGDPAAP